LESGFKVVRNKIWGTVLFSSPGIATKIRKGNAMSDVSIKLHEALKKYGSFPTLPVGIKMV
jgi:hypothetical protein